MIFSKILLILSLIFGFGHQTAPIAVSTPVPAIIEAPKGVVEGGVGTTPSYMDESSPKNGTTTVLGLPSTTSFFNPNYHYMEPENIPAAEPVEVTEVETKPEYIAPAEETPGHVDGTEYSTKGY